MPTFVILGVKDPWVPTYFASMWVSPSLEAEVGTGQAWREIPSLPSLTSFVSGPTTGERRGDRSYGLGTANPPGARRNLQAVLLKPARGPHCRNLSWPVAAGGCPFDGLRSTLASRRSLAALAAVVRFRRGPRDRGFQDGQGFFLHRLAALGRRIGTPGVLSAKLFAPGRQVSKFIRSKTKF